MKKSIIIALVLILLAGSGIAFAEYGSGNGFLGLRVGVNEDFDVEENGKELGEAVAEQAQELAPEGIMPEVEQENGELEENNGQNENGDENRSEVAEAVLNVLGDGVMPEDGAEFGEAVSSQARENGADLGRRVSEAARGAAGNNR